MSRHPKRVTVRLLGGLGNQLFSYAAARRLALVNDAELRIDHLSGFRRDGFQRQYALYNFNIPQNLVSESELFVRSRICRGLLRKFSELLPFHLRPYLVETGNDFDERLVTLKLRRDVYLQGYWQSERYFKDIEPQIREDLKIISKPSPEALTVSRQIERAEAVGVHVRRMQIASPLPLTYYLRAAEYIMTCVDRPHFFIFSDFPDWVEKNLRFGAPINYVTQGLGDESGWIDLWLMSLCSHFIIANSTFSWWGAWLGMNPEKVVIYPSFSKNWGHVGLVPDAWVMI